MEVGAGEANVVSRMTAPHRCTPPSEQGAGTRATERHRDDLGRLGAASTFPVRRDGVRLLVIDPAVGAVAESRFDRLAALLRASDLVVVNDAATLPASLHGRDERGEEIEVRLVQQHGEGSFSAVLFGPGDWRVRTEHRAAPRRLTIGARLRVGDLTAEVTDTSEMSQRLYRIRFDRDGDALWAGIYRAGKPVQYAHLAHELPLWAVQNVYAARPWAFEMASAGRPLSWRILLELRRRGVEVAALTHAAGLSATGDPELDARLPLRERYEIPEETVAAVARARKRGGRVVAVGTTVVRALEGSFANFCELRAGAGDTDLRIGPDHRLRVVDGLISGLHEPGESHFSLLRAFAPEPLLHSAHHLAHTRGFLSHELGDAALILAGTRSSLDDDGGEGTPRAPWPRDPP
jgi:S-adenosylmethionine:tRNA ribosyltransferase-isomerase